MTAPSLLVLAAGMGSRYGGLKQIDPIGPDGETIMDYSIYDALRAGFGKVVFVSAKRSRSNFRQTIGARFDQSHRSRVRFSGDSRIFRRILMPAGRTKPWGTTQADSMPQPMPFTSPLQSSMPTIFTAPKAFARLRLISSRVHDDYAMIGFVLRNTLSDFGAVARGICQVDAQGFLKSIVERTNIERDGSQVISTDSKGAANPLSGDEIVSMNIWGFTPEIFRQLRREF